MATTDLADIIIPEVFAGYVQVLTAEKSAFVQSGVLAPNALLNGFLAGGGDTIQMPFFNPLAQVAANISTDAPGNATPQNIDTGRNIAQRQSLNQVWASYDLVQSLAGADPLEAISNQVASYWTQQLQTRLILTIRGLIADNEGDEDDMVFNITNGSGAVDATNFFSGEAFLDAAATMGDAADSLGVVAMHSVPFTRAQKNNLIDFIPDARGEVEIPTFLGRRVVVDDGMPTIANGPNIEYSTYLFGAGALSQGVGSPRVAAEVNREPLQAQGGGEEFLHSRILWAIHPEGFQWTGNSQALKSPSEAELILATNWDRAIAERRLIKLAELRTNG